MHSSDPPGAQAQSGVGADELIWHYTDGAGLVSILSGHTLWATSSAFLNDMQEVELGVERIGERLRELAVGDDTYRLITDRLDPRKSDVLAAVRCYILSASQSGDSLAMWRLYGGQRESYAIGLDPAARLSVLGEGIRLDDEALADEGIYLKRMRWEPVRYDADAQAELIEAVVDDLPAQISEIRSALLSLENDRPRMLPATTWALVREVLDDLEQALVLTKHAGFADEREVRQAIIMHTFQDRADAGEVDTRLLRYRPTGYGIAPYLRLTGGEDGLAVVDAPLPLPIRSVAISPSPNGPAAEESVRSLLHRHGYRDVAVRRSTIPYRD